MFDHENEQRSEAELRFSTSRKFLLLYGKKKRL